MSRIPEPPWARGGGDPTIGLHPSLTYPEVLSESSITSEERSWKREEEREKTMVSSPGRP